MIAHMLVSDASAYQAKGIWETAGAGWETVLDLSHTCHPDTEALKQAQPWQYVPRAGGKKSRLMEPLQGPALPLCVVVHQP